MAKLPTALLPRTLPSSGNTAYPTLLTTASRPTTAARRTPAQTTQVRHATEVLRPKRPFTWTQVVQLSDGSTFTTRTTAPQAVHRSTKDTRNHLLWQPSEVSLQNVELDEAGKLASFRGRFGADFDLVKDPAAAAAEQPAASKRERRRKGGKKETNKAKVEAAVEEDKKDQDEEDSFAQLMAAYVREQASLKGGLTASKATTKKPKN